MRKYIVDISSEREKKETGGSGEDGKEYNEVNDIDYKLCCLYDDKDKKCGPFCERSIKSGLVEIVNLTADTESYFKNLRFKESLDNF